MVVKRKLSAGAALIAVVLAGAASTSPSMADPPLAGEMLVADTHGQAFCTTPEALQRYLLATIQHDPYTIGTFYKLCTIAPTVLVLPCCRISRPSAR